MINQILNPEGFNFFSLCRGICQNVFHFFTLTCLKPSNSFRILQPLSNKTNQIFMKTTNKRYYLFSQCSIIHACIFNSKSLYCATTSTLYIQECTLSNLEQHIRAEKVTYYRDSLKNSLPRLFVKLKTGLHYREYIIQIYHVWEGYLRKIPVERRNISQAEWRVKFRVEYDFYFTEYDFCPV